MMGKVHQEQAEDEIKQVVPHIENIEICIYLCARENLRKNWRNRSQLILIPLSCTSFQVIQFLAILRNAICAIFCCCFTPFAPVKIS